VSVVANVAINVDSRGAVSKLRQVQQGAQATQRAFGALQSAIAGIGVASIAAQTLKAAASFNDLQTRLKLLTSEYGEYTQAQQFAAKAAKQFGLSNREAATGVADIYGRLRPLGVSLKDIQSTFNGFNTIARLSGISAEGASAAFLQLGQALGSGQLQGDEFRSIAEQVPGLLVAVSKETGIAAKDLKQFASDGELSADIVINALKRIESEGAGKITALVQNSDTQKFKDLQNAVDDLSITVGNELLPVVTPLIKDLTSLVGTIAALPDPVKNATGELIKLIIQLLLVEKAIKAIIALNAAFVAAQVAMAGATASTGAAATTSAGAFALYTNNARTLQATSVAATASVSGLAGALLGLAGIGIITVGINYVITQTGAIIGSSTAAGKSEAAGTAGGLAAQLKGKSAAERKQMLAAAQKNLANDKKLASALALQIQMQDNAALSSSERALPSDRSRLTELQARINTNQARIKAIQTTPIERAKPTPTPTPTTATGAGTGAKKGSDDAKRAAEEKRRAAEELANLQGQVTLKEKLFGIDKQIAVEKQRGSIVTAAALEMDKALEERQARIAEITRSTADTATKNAQIKEATLDADQKIYAVQQAIKEQETERTKSFNEIIAGLDLELALKTATTEQAREQLRLAYELAKLQGQGFTPEQIGAITAKKTELARPKTDRERLEGAAAGVKAELDALTDPINMITTAAAGIGDAFSTSFKGIISGSMTAKEALASFFTSVADMFLDMAAQIIAKMITMAILNAVLGVLPGAGGAGSGTLALSSNPNVGAYMGGGGIEGITMGTFGGFKANGGPVSSGQTYMVGERGPELFVPGRSGTIVANDKMGGGSTNVIVNVDAKGSSVEGNEQGANQLGRVISAAVQSELIKQQRPGGILAR
jgi:tape measure domain-containing protein